MKQIVDAARSGIMRTIGDHFSFSRKESLWTVPEYMFTASISRQITTLRNPRYRVDVEDPIEGVIREAGGWGSDRIPADVLRKGRSRKGRFDIVLSESKSRTPFGIIEVKKAIGPRGVKSDAERICAVLNRVTPTIKWGVLAIVIPGQNDAGKGGYLERRMNSFEHTVRDYVGNWNVISSDETVKLGNGRRYGAMVFGIGPLRAHVKR